MKKLIPIFLLVLTSCAAPANQSETPAAAPDVKAVDMAKKAKSCICPKIWLPVCGEDGRTYGNNCEADCAGVKYTMGECQIKK